MLDVEDCTSLQISDLPELRAMQVIIRPAEPRDVPRMLALVKELAVFERAPAEVTVTLEHMWDAGFGKAPVWFGWVAEGPVDSCSLSVVRGSTGGGPDNKQPTTDNPILGLAICYERYSTWKGRRLYLEDIIVTEAARGQRIGEMLFMACVRHAVAKNYSGMLWQVLDWNTDAIRFYERFEAEFSGEWLNGTLGREQLTALVKRSGS